VTGGDSLNNFSMLGLFRMEAETQAQMLSDGLIELEKHPGDASKIEPLMRAAHSLKGAARIVQLDFMVNLTHAMEDCFVAAQEGRVLLTAANVDSLLKGVDIISKIPAMPEEEILQWLDGESGNIEDLIKVYGEIQKQGNSPEPSDGENEHNIDVQAESVDLGDFSMLGLFRMEAETQVHVLADGLMALEENPSDLEKIEPLMRAAHSLKGAARIVQLDPAVELAHSMEDCFVAAQEGKVLLGESEIDKLLAGVDFIRKVSELNENEINGWLSANLGALRELSGHYIDIKNGKALEDKDAFEAADKGKKEEEATMAQEAVEKDKHISSGKDNFVRVTAEKLNKLLGLAGESLVDSRRIHLFENSLMDLKRDSMQMSETISELCDSLGEGDMSPKIKDLINKFREGDNDLYRATSELLSDFSNFSIRADNFSDNLYNEVVSCRMRPFEDGIKAFPRMVRDISKKLGKKVKLEMSGRKTDVDRDILEKLEAPLNHLLRNAIDHGLETREDRLASGKPETGTVKLSAKHWAGTLNITVSDDGKGINIEKLREKIVQKGHASKEMAESLSEAELLEFLFLPGFSTAPKVTEISGRGVGLDVVQNMVQEVRGVVKAETTQGQGTCFHLQLPITLSVISTLLVEIGGEPYAFPLMSIDRLLVVSQDEISSLENHQFLNYENTNIGIVSAKDVLGFPMEDVKGGEMSVIVISDRLNQYAIVVDRFVEERELVVRPLDERLGKIPDISAASVMEDGAPVFIVDVDDMVRSIDNLMKGGRLKNLSQADPGTQSAGRKRVLVVDDSITVREVEKHLLVNRGYEVEIAVDGADAWNALRIGAYDIVVTDVDMPRMNGIELVSKMKAHDNLKSIPVMIVSYKDREEDKLKGLEAGADYYLTKSSFHDNTLIEAVANLIGEAEE